MAFLSPILLLGTLLVGIPIALHLRRRQDPVRVEFPALRLLKRNRHKTEKQLRVRRWALLALRCVLLAMLAAALARPLFKPTQPPSADGGPVVDGDPVGEGLALAVVIDSGPNTAYQSRNRSRLDEARELAGVLLGKLPAETPIVLADRSSGSAANIDPSAAAARVDRLRGSPAARPLGLAIRDAVTQLGETPAARREAYVFTDFSAGAWDDAARRTVAATLNEHPGVVLKLVDVGAAEPRNAAIDGLRLRSESLAAGEALAMTASLHTVGAWRDPLAVQLWLDADSGPVKRDERLVQPSDTSAIDFALNGLPEGFATGFVRVVAGDAAPADDVRHFAVEVRRPRSVLIVAPREQDAVFFRSAIDPVAAEPGASRRFETRVIDYGEWARKRQGSLRDDAIVLCDPPTMVARGGGWRRLYNHAVGGGGVGVFLGRGATLEAFNSPDAQAVLPGELVWRSRDPTYLRPRAFNHPAIKPLAPYADDLLWSQLRVAQRWELDTLRDGATVVARYADGGPAIVERGVGRGRVVLMTTSVSESPRGDDAWNVLPIGDDGFPFVLLANALTDYLTGSADARLGYTAGETVTAPLPAGSDAVGYVLRTPGGEPVRQSIPPGRGELTIASATEPGAYRIETGGELDRRFVVNLDPSAGRLERVSFAELATEFGEDRVALVRGRDQLARSIDLGRVGRELYGWVLAIAAIALLGEQWVSSNYYRDGEPGPAKP